MEPRFIHLQCHSEFSLVDGLLRIKDILKACVQHQMPAVAVTDLGNLFCMVKFYKMAIQMGVKPIIGSEVWIENEQTSLAPHRLILLCKDKAGYHNLTYLISKAYYQGQRHAKPIIQKTWLRKRVDGLIAIAPGLESDIGCALCENKHELGETLIEYWSGMFPQSFYLGITRLGKPKESEFVQACVNLAIKKHCPVVALNHVCFLHKEDYEAHEARVCINSGFELGDSKRPKLYTQQQYFKTQSEMNALFEDMPGALQNSVEIAKRCNLRLTLGEVYLPQYPIPKGNTIESYFTEVSKTGLAQRIQEYFVNTPLTTEQQKIYYDRLNVELSVISKMGFAGYFLIVADFIQWAKNHDIPVGPGRGSGAGSLVAFALGITGLDPLQYDLLFERFLNPERVSMPDFDIDFCMEGRDRVIDYVAETYGREAVSQIITYGTMAAKAVIRDVGRVLGYPYTFVDKIAKLIPLELGITLDKALEQEEALRERYEQEDEVKTLIDLAKKLEGITRNVGKHAGGVVIAPSKLTDFSPLYCEENGAQLVTQFDKNDVEEIGLVKFDFLGLRTLTIIHWTCQSIREQLRVKGQVDKSIDNIDRLPLDCVKTFELLCACQTTAVFQLESRGMKDLIRRLQPDCFEDIIALVALFRPGPLQSGMVDDFINRKLGRAEIAYLHPKLEPVLKPTYGIILYQEQVMQIAQILAGYTLGAADLLRRAMGKKKPEEMAKQRDIFTKGAVERGIDEQVATSIFDLMEKFAGYGFNKSHSAAYALVSYQTAWLKAHYPACFMAAVLSSDMPNTDKIVLFLEDCKKIGLTVLPPDVNQSLYKFSVNEKDNIIFGLGAIKGVGEAAINSLLDARKQAGPFKDLFDFCARVDLRKVTKKVIEVLIKSGSFDHIEPNRALLIHQMPQAVHAAEQIHKNKEQGQNDLFGTTLSVNDIYQGKNITYIHPWTASLRLEGEKQTLGFYLTGHPIDEYTVELQQFVSSSIGQLTPREKATQTIAGFIVNLRTMITKRGDKMAFISIDDKTGRQEVAVFSSEYHKYRDLIRKDQLIVIQGEVAHDDYSGGLKMRATHLMDLATARQKYAKGIHVSLLQEKINGDFSIRLKHFLSEFQHQENRCPLKLKINYHNAEVCLQLGDNWGLLPTADALDNLKQLIPDAELVVCYD